MLLARHRDLRADPFRSASRRDVSLACPAKPRFPVPAASRFTPNQNLFRTSNAPEPGARKTEYKRFFFGGEFKKNKKLFP